MSNLSPPAIRNLQRYSMPEAERILSDRLGLNWDAQMQDWDLNNSNPIRVPEFLDALSNHSLSDDEYFALMGVTIASVDEALQIDCCKQVDLEKLENLLLLRPHLYVSTVLYWAEPAMKGYDVDEQFAISEMMASIWKRMLSVLLPNQAFNPDAPKRAG
jgi:hypothetical protein